MSALPQLLAMRELLSDPMRWTQGMMAADDLGSRVGAKDPAACCWCIMGADCLTDTANVLHRDTSAVHALRATITAFDGEYCRSVSGWNDMPGRTHEEVLRLIDATIVRESGLAGAIRGDGPCLEF